MNHDSDIQGLIERINKLEKDVDELNCIKKIQQETSDVWLTPYQIFKVLEKPTECSPTPSGICPLPYCFSRPSYSISKLIEKYPVECGGICKENIPDSLTEYIKHSAIRMRRHDLIEDTVWKALLGQPPFGVHEFGSDEIHEELMILSSPTKTTMFVYEPSQTNVFFVIPTKIYEGVWKSMVEAKMQNWI
jgi:hypothetical protein